MLSFTLEHNPQYANGGYKNTMRGIPTGHQRYVHHHELKTVLQHMPDRREVQSDDMVEFKPGDRQRTVTLQKV